MNLEFSDRRRQVLATSVEDVGRFIVIPGPVRSGKSFSGVGGFFTYTVQFEDTYFGLAAPSQKQIQNVLLSAARTLGVPLKPSNEFIYVPSAGKPNKLVTFPIERAESEKRIAGHTFQGVLIDEAVDCNETAVNVLIERCSLPGAKIWMITNPKQPTHWVNERFIMNIEKGDLPGVHIPFSLDDNPSLDLSLIHI